MKKAPYRTRFVADKFENAECTTSTVEMHKSVASAQPDPAARSGRRPLMAVLNFFEPTAMYVSRSSAASLVEQLLIPEPSVEEAAPSTLSAHVHTAPRRRASKWRHVARRASEALLALMYHAYLAWCLRRSWDHCGGWCHGGRFMLVLTLTAYAAFGVVKAAPLLEVAAQRSPGLRRLLAWRNKVLATVLAILVAGMLWDINGELKRMTSFAGLTLLLLLGYALSRNRDQISWGPVAVCVAAMFASGLSLLRSELGSAFASCVVSKLRGYAWWVTAGGRFAFGYLAQGANMSEHLGPTVRGVVDVPPVFAFTTLPSLCYVAALVRTLYYLGFVQACLAGIDRRVVGLGFNSYEVVIALVSILNGPMESMLLLHPYLLTMSGSSLHCVFALEWSTVSGQLVPVYVDLGVNSTYLVSASILSVPAALAYSKLVYPESEADSQLCEKYRSPEKTLIEAVTTGAMVGVYMVLAIVANVLTYSSLARFLDACVTWTASNVGAEHLGLQWLLERAYQPVALLMGVSWQDSRTVAQLLAIKVILNEYVAFTAFVKTADKLEERSRMLATFALCDFSNLGLAGATASLLGMVYPRKCDLFASVLGQAFISSLAASVLTACVAGCLTC